MLPGLFVWFIVGAAGEKLYGNSWDEIRDATREYFAAIGKALFW